MTFFKKSVLFQNFIKCGITGWCMEILFTSLDSFRRREMQLKGTTSIWMFPIYGCAAFLTPLHHLLKNKSYWLRGSVYMSFIFCMEYFSGNLLSKHKLCPWDYKKSRWNVKRLIRLDFAPFWFGVGLLFETLLSSPTSVALPNQKKSC